MTDLLHSHLIWYLNRGTGVVLVAVLTLSTVLGVLATRGGSPRWPRFALQTLHRNVSLLACALLVAHAATPVLDTYVNHYASIGPVDALVPFVAAYRPFALGLGTLALDLVAAVVLTSVVRRRLGHRTWFRVHLLAYASWGLGVVHGLLIGTDARTTWSIAVTGASVALVLAAVVVRLLSPRALPDVRSPEPVLVRPAAPAQQPLAQPAEQPQTRRGRRLAEEAGYAVPPGDEDPQPVPARGRRRASA